MESDSKQGNVPLKVGQEICARVHPLRDKYGIVKRVDLDQLECEDIHGVTFTISTKLHIEIVKQAGSIPETKHPTPLTVPIITETQSHAALESLTSESEK